MRSDSNSRACSISVGKQLGTILGGGVAPLVATALMASSGGNIVTVVSDFVVLSALALAAAWAVKEPRGREL